MGGVEPRASVEVEVLVILWRLESTHPRRTPMVGGACLLCGCSRHLLALVHTNHGRLMEGGAPGAPDAPLWYRVFFFWLVQKNTL